VDEAGKIALLQGRKIGSFRWQHVFAEARFVPGETKGMHDERDIPEEEKPGALLASPALSRQPHSVSSALRHLDGTHRGKTPPRAEATGTRRLFYKPLSVKFRHDGFTITDKDAAFAKLRGIYRDGRAMKPPPKENAQRGMCGQLPAFVQDMLTACPRAGEGVHNWLFKVARHPSPRAYRPAKL